MQECSRNVRTWVLWVCVLTFSKLFLICLKKETVCTQKGLIIRGHRSSVIKWSAWLLVMLAHKCHALLDVFRNMATNCRNNCTCTWKYLRSSHDYLLAPFINGTCKVDTGNTTSLTFSWPTATSMVSLIYTFDGVNTSTTQAVKSLLQPGQIYSYTLNATVSGGATSPNVYCVGSTGIIHLLPIRYGIHRGS